MEKYIFGKSINVFDIFISKLIDHKTSQNKFKNEKQHYACYQQYK